MSQMNARYAGTCRKCGGSIHPGDLIEWSKGAGATHVQCPEKKVEQSVRMPHRGTNKYAAVPVQAPAAPVLRTPTARPKPFATIPIENFFISNHHLITHSLMFD
jgi:hypothetical protein